MRSNHQDGKQDWAYARSEVRYRGRRNHVRFVVRLTRNAQRTRPLLHSAAKPNRHTCSTSTCRNLNCVPHGLCLCALLKNWSAILRPTAYARVPFMKTGVLYCALRVLCVLGYAAIQP